MNITGLCENCEHVAVCSIPEHPEMFFKEHIKDGSVILVLPAEYREKLNIGGDK